MGSDSIMRDETVSPTIGVDCQGALRGALDETRAYLDVSLARKYVGGATGTVL